MYLTKKEIKILKKSLTCYKKNSPLCEQNPKILDILTEKLLKEEQILDS
ncbi:MAG: hypothetical protein ACOCP8_00570 [archaeon]